MKKELFKDIPDYEGKYLVSDLGNVKSLSKGVEKILKPSKNKGYLQVVLFANDKAKTFKIHKLVMMAFLDHKPSGMKEIVNHKNFDRSDNRLDNLELVTNRENGNKKHLKSSSKYVGVGWHKDAKKWVSQIHVNGKLKYLGIYEKEEDAHVAYQNELINLNN